MSFLWVFLGGGFGSVMRYMIGTAFFKTNISLPVATLLANCISCFIFATTLWVFREKIEVPSHIRQFLLIGVCGGLSTFSAFSFETFELFRNQQHLWALGNILLNTLICFSIFYIFNKVS